jgi:hypothetical protein
MPLHLHFNTESKVCVVVSDELVQAVIFVEVLPGSQAIEVFEEESGRLFSFVVGDMTNAARLETL